jgi:hypothetical protein
MQLRPPRMWVIALAAIGLSLSAQPSKAGYQTATYTFTQSNTLADGVNYGTVTVESWDGLGSSGGGLLAGQIRFTVDATTAPYVNGIGNNFGIQHFGFNFANLEITAADISALPPTGWSFDIDPSGGGFGPFGKFDAQADGTGNNRRDPLVIMISNQGSDALIANVTLLSDPATEPAYFAAHVAGFNEIDGADSHKIGVTDLGNPGGGGGGGGEIVPAPAGLILFASAVPMLALRRLIRRKPVA